MAFLPFAKVIPGGNATILIDDADLSARALASIAPELMSENHLQAEQVGQITRLEGPGPTHHLQMMGGEFCVNATRAAAAFLAFRGEMTPLPAASSAPLSGNDPKGCVFSLFTVSGEPAPLPVFAAPTEPALFAALARFAGEERAFVPARPEVPVSTGRCQWFTAARIPCALASAAPMLPSPCEGVHCVRLPGITHLLIDTALHGQPENHSWQRESARWRCAHEEGNEAAFGVIWYSRTEEGYSILPAVFVRATHSECLETACGSASLAVALLHRQAAPFCPAPLPILQPGGNTLAVLFCGNAAAWVIGPTLIAAHGMAWCNLLNMPEYLHNCHTHGKQFASPPEGSISPTPPNAK